MDLQEYFSSTQGTGILATAGASGTVTTTMYAKSRIREDGIGHLARIQTNMAPPLVGNGGIPA